MASPHSPQQDVTTFRETEVRHAESAPEPDGCCGYQSVEVADDESFDPCVGDGSKENNDTVAPPAWWRTAIAVVTTSFFDEALVSYHVSNLVTEMQSERETASAVRHGHKNLTQREDSATKERIVLEERLHELWQAVKDDSRSARASIDLYVGFLDEQKWAAAECTVPNPKDIKTVLCDIAFKLVTDTAGKPIHDPVVKHAASWLMNIKEALLSEALFPPVREHMKDSKNSRLSHRSLLCSLRGPAGESIFHWALLLESYDFALWLFDLEPMLLSTIYEKPAYLGESALHILAAKKELKTLRKLAKKALFWEPRDSKLTDENERRCFDLCEKSWAVLSKYLSKTGVLQTPPNPLWRQRWLRLIWSLRINGLAVGTFFEPVESGGSCYYGGTPLSISVAMGEPTIVRFLTIEVGCTDLGSWDDRDDEELYPCVEGPLANFTRKRRVLAAQLQSWDPHVCARIDLPDRFGNTAGHIAVRTHSDAHMFLYLNEMYADGFGRNPFRIVPVASSHADSSVVAISVLEPHRDGLKAPGEDRSEVVVALRPIETAPALFPDRDQSELISSEEQTIALNKWKEAFPDFLPQLVSIHRVHRSVPTHSHPTFQVLTFNLTRDQDQGNASQTTETVKRFVDPVNGFNAEQRRRSAWTASTSGDGGAAESLPPVTFAIGDPLVLDGCTTRANYESILDVGPTPSNVRSIAVPCYCSLGEFTAQCRGDKLCAAENRARFSIGHAECPSSVFSCTCDADAAPKGGACSRSAQPDGADGVAATSCKCADIELIDIVNSEGLTPFTLAVFLGKRGMFESLWTDCRSKNEWKWGGVDCNILRLDQVDDIGQVIDTLDARDQKRATSHPAPTKGSQTGPAKDPLFFGGSIACKRNQGSQGGADLRDPESPLIRILRWWLPLPFELSAPVPPTALDLMVRFAKHELLDNAGAFSLMSKSAQTAAASGLATAAITEHMIEDKKLNSFDKNASGYATMYSDYMRDATRLLTRGEGAAAHETPLLSLLNERKWQRLYKIKFYKLAVVRFVSVVVAFGLLITRVNSNRGRTPLIITLAVGAWAVFIVHLLRHLRYGCTPCSRRSWSLRATLLKNFLAHGTSAFDDPLGSAVGKVRLSREVQLYTASHGGTFGTFYLYTLLLGSGFLAVGSIIDLVYAWQSAGAVYAFGSFFSFAHLLYFSLGFESSGPLVVTFAITISREFMRWLSIWFAVAFSFASFFYFIDASTNSYWSYTDATWNGLSIFFRRFFVQVNFDNSFNPQPSSSIDQLPESESVIPMANNTLFLLLWMAYIMLSSVGLVALLIAQMTRLFDTLSSRMAEYHVERVRACMLLESLMNCQERLMGINERDRYWIRKSATGSPSSAHAATAGRSEKKVDKRASSIRL